MLYFHNMFIHKKFLPDVSVETKSTLQETNISHPKALLKRTFLSPRSDMLVPRNVCMDHQVFGHVYWMNACVWPFSPTQSMFVHTHHPNEYASIFLSTFSCQVFFGILFISYTNIYIYISCFYIYRRVYTTLLSSLTITTFESPKRLRHRRSWSRNAGMILRRNRWSHNGWRMKSHWFFVTTLR